MLLCQQLRFLRKSDNTSKIRHRGYEILFLQRCNGSPKQSPAIIILPIRFIICPPIQALFCDADSGILYVIEGIQGALNHVGVCFFIPVPANRSRGFTFDGKLTLRQINYLEQKDRHKYFLQTHVHIVSYI